MNKIYLFAIITYILAVVSGLFFHHIAVLSTIGAPVTATTTAIQSGHAPTTVFPLWELGLELVVVFIITIILVRKLGKFIMKGYGYFIFLYAMLLLLFSLTIQFYPTMPILLFAGILIASMLIYWKTHKTYLNFFSVIASIIFAGYFGYAYSPLLMISLFIGLCAFDLIAVFFTDVMGGIVKDAVTNFAPIFVYNGSLEEIRGKLNPSLVKKTKNKKEDANIGLLGTGDLIIGGGLAANVAVYINPVLGIVVAIGALLGLYLNIIICKNRGMALPALPLILASEITLMGIWLSPSFFPLLFIAPIFLVCVFSTIDKLALWKLNKIKKEEKFKKQAKG